MKYIKLFESDKSEMFWKVPTEMPDLHIALRKIGMKEKDIPLWIETIENEKENRSPEYVFIFKSAYYKWTWGDFSDENFNYFKLDNEYMGEVYITRDDMNNWETEQVAKKYNL